LLKQAGCLFASKFRLMLTAELLTLCIVTFAWSLAQCASNCCAILSFYSCASDLGTPLMLWCVNFFLLLDMHTQGCKQHTRAANVCVCVCVRACMCLLLFMQYMKKLTERNRQLEAEKEWSTEQLRLKQLECDGLIQVRLLCLVCRFVVCNDFLLMC